MLKKKAALSLLLIAVMLITSLSVFAAEGTTVVEGTIQATVVSFTAPATTTFVLNPNGATPEERFVAPEFSLTNTSQAPIKVEVSTFTKDASSVHTFTDVLPAAYSDADWLKLGRTKSESEIALAIKAKDALEWKLLTQTASLYAAEVTAIKAIGEIDPGLSAKFTMEAKHGNAFSAGMVTKYKIVFVFSLA